MGRATFHRSGRPGHRSVPIMPVVIILVCVAVFITGTILAIRSGGLIMRCLQASHWPTTTAMLLEAEDQDLSGAEDTHHRIRVLYTYDVA